MKKRIFSLLILTIVISLLSACESEKAYNRQFTYFDTVESLTVYAKNEDEAASSFSYALSVFKLYQNITDRYQEEDDGYKGIYSINAGAGKAVTVTKELLPLLSFAIENAKNIINDKGHPYFTIAIGKVSDIWHPIFDEYNEASECGTAGLGHLPDSNLLNASYDTDASKIIIDFDNNTVSIPEDMSIDLGGIVKGYVGEILGDYFDSKNIHYVLDLGSSNIKTNYGNPKRANNAYIIGLRNPDYLSCDDGTTSNIYAKINLPIGKSIITSGDYQKYITYNDKRYCHILDPETNSSGDTDIRSVSIIMEDGALGDLYSTSLFLMGLDKAYQFVESHEGIEAIFYTSNGKIYATEGMKDCITMVSGFTLSNYGK